MQPAQASAHRLVIQYVHAYACSSRELLRLSRMQLQLLFFFQRWPRSRAVHAFFSGRLFRLELIGGRICDIITVAAESACMQGAISPDREDELRMIAPDESLRACTTCNLFLAAGVPPMRRLTHFRIGLLQSPPLTMLPDCYLAVFLS